MRDITSANSIARLPRCVTVVVAVVVVVMLTRMLLCGPLIYAKRVQAGDRDPTATIGDSSHSSPSTNTTTASAAPIAADWPSLRGPRLDGHSVETGLVEGWGDEGPVIVWRAELGQGYSSFVGVGNRVVTQRQTLAGQSVVCLDADSGRIVWEYRYGPPYEVSGLYPGPRATPTIARGHIFFAGTDGLVGCLTLQGGLRWSVRLYDRFGGKPPGFGFSGTPVIDENRLYLAVGVPGASLVALDTETGRTLWQHGDAPASYTPVLPIEIERQKIVVGFLENTLVAHDGRTGERLWSLELSSGYDEHAAWPIYREPDLWISRPFRAGSRRLTLTRDGMPPSQAWAEKRMSNDVMSSVLVEGHLYGFDLRDIQAKVTRPSRGEFRCLDWETGAVRWSTDRVGHANVIVAEGKLILVTDAGELVLARASSAEYVELSRWRLLEGEVNLGVPALHRGRLYIRSHTQAVCVDLRAKSGSANGPAAARAEGPGLAAPAGLRGSGGWDWGLRPEWTGDVPAWDWLWMWYGDGALVLVLAGLAAAGGSWFAGRRAAAGAAVREGLPRGVYWCVGAVVGLAGTMALTRCTGAFHFTWMVLPFLASDLCFQAFRVPPSARPVGRLRGYLRLAVLLGTCGLYYWLCDQHNLAANWVFLVGLCGSFPLFCLGLRFERNPTRRRWTSLLVEAAAYTAFYWTAVALLATKYTIPPHAPAKQPPPHRDHQAA